MAVLYTNNATTTLAAAINTSATALSLATGTGTLFPSPSSPDFFYVTITNSGGTVEICKCTARSSDTLTVVRNQEGTAPTAYSIGDKVELRVTAAGLANKLDKDTGGTLSGPLTVTGTITPTTLAVSANATVGGTLTITGATSLSSLSTSGNGSIGGTLGVTGAATFGSTASFAGAITATGGVIGNLTGTHTGNITGPTTLTGTLTVTGAVTASAGLTVTSGLSVDSFSGSGLASTTDVSTGTSTTKVITPASLAGAAGIASAWVKFSGQTSNGNCTILKSKNVASVARTGVGTYTINFTNPLNDGNYAITGMAYGDLTGNGGPRIVNGTTTANTTSSAYISITNTGSATDPSGCSVQIFD